jgi:hypothetical protein
MSTWDGGFSQAQNFHPEFGYLCPSAQFRRKARNTVITLAAGGLIAGSVALALLPQLTPQSPGDGGHEATALRPMAAPPVDRTADLAADLKATSPADASPTDESVPARTAARTVAAERAAAAHAQASCDDLSGAFLAPQCQLGKAGKSHAAHVAHEAGTRVASVSIGRAGAALQAGPQDAAAPAAGQEPAPRIAAASRSAPAAEAAATVVAANEAPSVVLPLPRPAVSDKKPVKIVHRQAPGPQGPGREVASADAPAAAHSGFDLFALFRQPPRTGTGFFQ